MRTTLSSRSTSVQRLATASGTDDELSEWTICLGAGIEVGLDLGQAEKLDFVSFDRERGDADAGVPREEASLDRFIERD